MKTMMKLKVLIAFYENLLTLIEFYKMFQSLILKTLMKLPENVEFDYCICLVKILNESG